jgi:putative membrane protein
VTVYLKGLAMGIADSVPGISGGTIALITGIYERLIRAITRLDPRVLRLVPGVYRREVRTAFFERLRGMDALFLIVLGSGMVTAIVTVARGAEIAFETFPGPTFAFFFGLIGASAVALADRRWLATPGRIGAAVVGFLVAFLVSGAVAEGLLPNSLPVVFLGGSVAISGMILPGISGAFILLLLGQYDYMIETLNGFVDAVLGRAEGAGNQLVQEGTVVVTFLAGAFVGLFTVAYVVRWALDSYREATFAFLVSLMIGALRYPAVEIAAATETVRIGTVMPIVAAGLIGAVAVLALDHYSADIDY